MSAETASVVGRAGVGSADDTRSPSEAKKIGKQKDFASD